LSISPGHEGIATVIPFADSTFVDIQTTDQLLNKIGNMIQYIKNRKISDVIKGNIDNLSLAKKLKIDDTVLEFENVDDR
jgi:hypothetical protein